jgi:hypothetical protein
MQGYCCQGVPVAILYQVIKKLSIKSRYLTVHDFFPILCHELKSEHISLLLHKKIRWLSSRQVLILFLINFDEMQISLTLQKHDMHNYMLTIIG